MDDDILSNDEQTKVDFLNPPESTPEGAQDFSMKAQQDKFLGGASGGEKSSRRLRVFEVSRFDIKKPTVEGIEKLPPNPCVVATTHLSDIDVQEIAMVVANQRKVGIVSQETNLTFPLYRPFVAAIGKENFFSIANAPYQGSRTAYSLRVDDLKKMEEGINQEGRTMIIAAHNPTRNWELAEKPGMAAVVLAHMANVPLVPAALDIESKTPVAQTTNNLARVKNLLNRPNAKIIFGEPLELSEIPEDKVRAAVGLYSPDQRRNMTPEQLAAARETLSVLQDEANRMMESLASKLPSEKRGEWGQAATQETQPQT